MKGDDLLIMFGWDMSRFLSPVITAVIIAVVAVVIYGLAKGLVSRLIDRSGKFNKQQAYRNNTIKSMLTSIIGYVIFFIAVVAILGEFNVDTSAIIASAGILGLAIGFGAQGLVSDVVTGFFVVLEDQVNVDEYVTVAGYSGIVEEVGFRMLKIRDFGGDLHFIPNREIGSLTNHSRGNMRALVDISISYEDNVDEVIRVLQAKCDEIRDEMPEIIEGPDVIGVQSLGASDVVIRVIARTVNMEQWRVERELRKGLKEALDKAGID